MKPMLLLHTVEDAFLEIWKLRKLFLKFMKIKIESSNLKSSIRLSLGKKKVLELNWSISNGISTHLIKEINTPSKKKKKEINTTNNKNVQVVKLKPSKKWSEIHSWLLYTKKTLKFKWKGRTNFVYPTIFQMEINHY